MYYLNNLLKYHNRIKIFFTSYFPLPTSYFHLPTSYFLLLTFFTSYFLLSSCSQATENGEEGVTFSGTVTLEGETNYSGVKISLYKPVELDTALVRINQQYPNIGVQISQETEFDHRDHEPVYTTMSGADGSWKIENVSKGEYNIVAEKDGYGWLYLLDNEDQVIALELIKLTMVNSSTLRFYNNIKYIVNTSVTIEEPVVLETGATLYFTSHSKLTINGNVTVFGDDAKYIVLTSDDITSLGSGIDIMSGDNDCSLNKLLIYKLNTGIKYEGKYISISNSIIKECNTEGIEISKADSVNINNNLITKNSVGISAFDLKAGIVDRNIILENENEGIVYKVANSLIRKNYVSKNLIGIFQEWNSNSKIEYNEILTNSEWGIVVNGISKPVIERNNILYNNSAINIPMTGYAHNAQPTINYNNILIDFSENSWLVKIIGSSSNPNELDVNAQNNFWGTQDQYMIDTYIYDKHDAVNQEKTGEVIYYPYEYENFNNVGILN